MNNGHRVLIVDDSQVMREMIGDVLKTQGFEVVGEATDGQEALNQYKKLKPDIVTMDVVMPKEHGIDAVKKIIAIDKEAKIIIISGLYQKTLVMEALDAGALDYVIKPFEPSELIETVNKNLKQGS
ncbi:MAG: response regulator [Candidatus Thorarchaeota archaeon]